MRLVQITDCHLRADPLAPSRAGFPLRQLQAVVEHARRQRPDVVLVSGDVSQDATPASYRHALDVLAALDCPWYWLPGNHDHLTHMADARPLHDQVDLGEWRMLLLNTQVVGQPHGEVGAAQCDWLNEQLADDTRPTLIAMHHPPLEVGADWMDAIGLQDRERFWATLEGHEQVKAVLCGHIHQAFAGCRAMQEEGTEVAVYGTPATADQFLPGAASFAIDQASRPGYRVIDLGQRGLATWVERVTL
ncbi:Icc protein [Franzmannia pantelleriensis]|uniref:Icc protein n=1 Tax=Franzmannia pantelleriensis TaxID=48727 RepID=A0A1G9GVI1_9GAMM|nr:phosphodiesterase [Halomonas pantelleriensis]SDL04720.1 Icc protein [Halomonas pantelleriensis]